MTGGSTSFCARAWMAYKVNGKPLSETSLPELQRAWINARSVRLRSAFEVRDAAFEYESALLEEIERRTKNEKL